MATSVRITQIRSMAEEGDPGEYKMNTTFTAATVGFHNELILIRKGQTVDDDAYEHICTVGDLNRYGTSRGDDLYYRVATWDLFYDSLEELADEVLVQQQKTQYVVTDWETYTGGTINQTYVHEIVSS